MGEIQRGAHAATRPVVVLVHGAWHGGWAWDEVARRLRARGCTVEAPDLPGADGQAGYGLTDQVTSLLTELRRHPRVVLVAHSFGALVARQAAATLPAGQVALLVLVDGWVVGNGQSFFDVMPEPMKERCAAAAVGAGRLKLVPAPPPAAFGVPVGPMSTWLQSRLTAQPWATFSEPSELDVRAAGAVPGHAILCEPSALPFRTMAEDLGYPISSLRSGHDAMVLDPAALTDLLVASIAAV